MSDCGRPLDERVYTPDSPLRHPLQMAAQMLGDLRRARFLAWRIFVRDVSGRYRQTLLGYVWIIIPPLFAAMGLALATRAQVIKVAATDIPYPAYVVFSMSLWQTFVDAVNAPLSAIEQSRGVLARLQFPREALLVARLGDVIVPFLVRVLLIAAALLWYRIPVPWSVALSLAAAFAIIAFGYSIGLLLAPFATLYHDWLKGIAMILTAWMFITPVLYPLPEGGGVLAALMHWNPVTPLLITVRELATGMPLSMLPAFLAVSALTVVLILLGWVSYKIALPLVIERLRA